MPGQVRPALWRARRGAVASLPSMTAAAVAMALLMTLTAVCKGVDVDTRSTSTLAQPKRVLVWMANPYAHGNVTIDSMIAGLKPNR